MARDLDEMEDDNPIDEDYEGNFSQCLNCEEVISPHKEFCCQHCEEEYKYNAELVQFNEIRANKEE